MSIYSEGAEIVELKEEISLLKIESEELRKLLDNNEANNHRLNRKLEIAEMALIWISGRKLRQECDDSYWADLAIQQANIALSEMDKAGEGGEHER